MREMQPSNATEKERRSVRRDGRDRFYKLWDDGGDHLVFHAKDGAVLHGATFWEEIWQSLA